MIQILDIHKKHKEENQAVADGSKAEPKKNLDDLLDGFEDDMQIDTPEYEKKDSVPSQAAPGTPATPSTPATLPVKKSLTDDQLDEKLVEFKGKKDQKEEKLFDSGKLMEDEEKEIITVD